MQYKPYREPQRKDPVAMIWIVLGLMIILAICIGVERLIPRY